MSTIDDLLSKGLPEDAKKMIPSLDLDKLYGDDSLKQFQSTITKSTDSLMSSFSQLNQLMAGNI